MRICIFGAGAVGGHMAAKLAAQGHDVSVVARGAHLEAIRQNGLKLLHGGKTIVGRVRAVERAQELGPQEAVFVALKANGLGAFAEQSQRCWAATRPSSSCRTGSRGGTTRA